MGLRYIHQGGSGLTDGLHVCECLLGLGARGPLEPAGAGLLSLAGLVIAEGVPTFHAMNDV